MLTYTVVFFVDVLYITGEYMCAHKGNVRGEILRCKESTYVYFDLIIF